MHEIELTMPKLSMTMEEGDFVGWDRKEGDEFRSGDVICRVMTDKTEMEVEAPVDGRLIKTVAIAGDTVAVGGLLGLIATEQSSVLDGLVDGLQVTELSATEQKASPDKGVKNDKETPGHSEEVAAPAPPAKRIAIAPAARRRASEFGIDLGSIAGSGPNGLITMADVDLAIAAIKVASEAPPAADPPRNTQSVQSVNRGTRAASISRATARVMSESALIPQFTLYRTIDLEQAHRQRRGVDWTTMFVAATALSLRRHPILNGSWGDHGGVVLNDRVMLGIAVDTDDGLMVPVLAEPDTKPLTTIATELKDLVGRTRRASLKLEDQGGATFTLSNLGGFGIDVFQALVTPPQAGVLSLGAIRRGIVATDDGLRIRWECLVGLTIDHRVANGADGARFLATLASYLESPDGLLELAFSSGKGG